VENAGVNCMEHQTKIIEKILSYVENCKMQEQIVRPIRLQPENAGVDFMENARVHRTAYINVQIKNHPKRGVDMVK